MRASLALAVLGGLLLGCSKSDNNGSGTPTGPDPRNCTKGSIGAPGVKTGTLSPTSCARYDSFWSADTTYYDSYDVSVTQGKGYLFTLESTTDLNFDLVLELVGHNPGTGADQLLAISDDDGRGVFAQLYFIAPVTGTFSLRAQGYDRQYQGAYVLTSHACDSPLPVINEVLAASSQTLAVTDCILEKPRFAYDALGVANDSSFVKLYSINIAPNDSIEINVTSAAFKPRFMVFGPTWGVPCDLGYDGCGGGAVKNPLAAAVADTGIRADGHRFGDGTEIHHLSQPGLYTLAVGGSVHTDVGAFTLTIAKVAVPFIANEQLGIAAFTPDLSGLRSKKRRPF